MCHYKTQKNKKKCYRYDKNCVSSVFASVIFMVLHLILFLHVQCHLGSIQV